MHIGKGKLSYRRIDDPKQDRSQAIAVKKLSFAHKFSSAGLTDINLTSLTAPTVEIPSWVNPSPLSVAAANLYTMPENLRLVSSVKGQLTPLAYVVVSNTLIRLKTGYESAVGEIIFGWVESTNTSGIIAVDARAICQTGTLTAGSTDIVVNEPFTYNKYSSQQVGDVLLFIDGAIQARCVGNNIAGEGNYLEVQPALGGLSNTLKIKTPFLSDVGYMIVSNGLVAERPTAAVMAKFESIGGTIDAMVKDLALVTGNPTSKYQAAPTNVDLNVFGERVNSYIRGILYDAVVGSADQYAAGKVTHTSVNAAIAAAPQGRILILAGTYSENIILSAANNNIVLEGKGHSTYITGFLGVSASGTSIKNIRFGNYITVTLSGNNNFIRECWMPAGFSLDNSGTANSLLVIQE